MQSRFDHRAFRLFNLHSHPVLRGRDDPPGGIPFISYQRYSLAIGIPGDAGNADYWIAPSFQQRGQGQFEPLDLWRRFGMLALRRKNVAIVAQEAAIFVTRRSIGCTLSGTEAGRVSPHIYPPRNAPQNREGMEKFYCIGCRMSYPLEKAARLTPAVHKDGEAVGFCFLCVREVQPSLEATRPVSPGTEIASA